MADSWVKIAINNLFIFNANFHALGYLICTETDSDSNRLKIFSFSFHFNISNHLTLFQLFLVLTPWHALACQNGIATFLSYCTTVIFLPLYQMSNVKIASGTSKMQLGRYPAPQLVSLIVCTEENCLTWAHSSQKVSPAYMSKLQDWSCFV